MKTRPELFPQQWAVWHFPQRLPPPNPLPQKASSPQDVTAGTAVEVRWHMWPNSVCHRTSGDHSDPSLVTPYTAGTGAGGLECEWEQGTLYPLQKQLPLGHGSGEMVEMRARPPTKLRISPSGKAHLVGHRPYMDVSTPLPDRQQMASAQDCRAWLWLDPHESDASVRRRLHVVLEAG